MNPELVAIVERLAELAAGSDDLSWQSTYVDVADCVADLRDHAQRLRRGDLVRLKQLRFALAPTGAINEIAISNGWSLRYLELANRFDTLLAEPGGAVAAAR